MTQDLGALRGGVVQANAAALAAQKRLADARKMPDSLRDLLKALPHDATPMDVVRTGVSILAHYDPEVTDSGYEANLRKAERLYGQIPMVIADQFRISKGLQPVAPKADDKNTGPKEKIDLPTAIQLCTLQNFRLQASATRIDRVVPATW